MKICKTCQIPKVLTLEFWSWRNDTKAWRPECKTCRSKKDKEYKSKRTQERYLYNKKYVAQHKVSVLEYGRKYSKKYRPKRNIQLKKRREIDSNFKLRSSLSSIINFYLRNNASSKNGNSIMKYLPYSINELKCHLESQFESWMTWKNWGKYNSKIWNESDSSTWTWQIDHIIPQSKLPYTSMEDENFKKCWALENLRPLSSKANLLKGGNLE